MSDKCTRLLQYNPELKSAFSNPDLPLAVVVARTKWDEPPRMRHQVTRQLMRWFNVLFVEFFPDKGRDLPSSKLRSISERLCIYTPVVPFTPSVRLYANFPIVHSLVNRQFVKEIRGVISKLNHSLTILANFVHDFPEIMKDRIYFYKTYFCFDEWPRMWRASNRPNPLKFFYQSRLYQRYENRVANQADRCLATHTPLVNKLRRVNPNTTLFLHGHEFRNMALIASERRNGSRIRIGFMGYISYRLLLDWLFSTLQSPDIELLLIGPMHSTFNPEPFRKYSNFRHVPPLAGTALFEALTEIDVLIMPYDPEIPENYVQTVSNKFFQYLAAGRPVVISDMPYYIEMPPGVIYRARNTEEFLQKIRQAYSEDCPDLVKLRQRIASENTWDKRGNMLINLIREDLEGSLPVLKAQSQVRFEDKAIL